MAPDPAVWFAMIEGQESDPMNRADLARCLASGEIDLETFVWKDGMDEWLPAREVEELAAVFSPPKRSRPPPPPPAAKTHKPKPKTVDSRPKPEPDSHVFRGRDDDSEEIVLELDLAEPPKKNVAPPVREPAKPTPAPAVATGSAPGQSRGLPKKPPSQPYGVPLPKESAKPPAQKALAEEDEEDWADRTSVEMLPFGERIHQQNVAGQLFDAGDPAQPFAPGKTGSYALDVSKWASGEMKSKQSDGMVKVAIPVKPESQPALTPPASVPTPAQSAPVARNKPASQPQWKPAPPPEEKKKPILLFVVIGLVVVAGIAVALRFLL